MLPLVHAARLTLAQMAVLEFVGEPRTVSAVAEYAGLSRPATSAMVDKLVRRGVVKRSEGQADRRERSVALTAKGRALLERVQGTRVARFEAALEVLSSGAGERLRGALEEAMGELEQDGRQRGDGSGGKERRR